ncbi:hypothetical protein WN944_023651 [Citrus x changshan-huyou]|uniref:Uncharacterized protein n=1 Tax=Citrus x changshan-huyou TaxID=2935761 RepID=A0AAP0N5U8_9ROSI
MPPRPHKGCTAKRICFANGAYLRWQMGHILPSSAPLTPPMASVMAEKAKFTRRQYVLSPYGELFDLPFLGS